MSDDQEFCLRWNDFHSSFHVSLDALRGDDAFTDVTISCGGHVLKAHRVILSACSTHFKEILKEAPPQQHTVMLLPTVEPDVMRAILEFIYQGQVNVRQARIGAFLQVAEKFAIQGLTDEAKKGAGKTPERHRDANAASAPPPAAKRRRLEHQHQHQPHSPAVSGAGPPPAPAPPLARSPEKTVNLALTVKPEPESMLEELEEILEPDQRLPEVPPPLDPAQDGFGQMSAAQDDGGGGATPSNFKRQTRSMVWEYFERITPVDARCMVCHKVFRQATGNTTNLRHHLRSHDVYLQSSAQRGGSISSVAGGVGLGAGIGGGIRGIRGGVGGIDGGGDIGDASGIMCGIGGSMGGGDGDGIRQSGSLAGPMEMRSQDGVMLSMRRATVQAIGDGDGKMWAGLGSPEPELEPEGQ